ncbi:hypothetical protein Clacol_006723 [Clathrus columnatus]|uniref:Uncharacterized protein n=1 Tax=Clathrus columnatus TaxID=1419009 RepID=A0AAV5ACW1_9AGAM|nr:hypothetical protein Clacol_006723 [Clathrus columnatus]
MTSASPPDISSLTLSPQRHQQRPNENYETYDGRTPYHFQTSPPIIPGGQNIFNTTQITPKSKSTRAALPSQWLDNTAVTPDSRPLSPPQSSDISSGGGSPSMSTQLPPVSAGAGDDEIIPTAIVIKNIPFNVKRETLLDIIASLNIPTPYAFNYHLDPAGAFRGLAFANFRLAQDADAVVAALNGFDVQGRKLRVEYKKVLQAGEKERIEREKALRRMRSMQLEKEQQAQAQVQGQVQQPSQQPPQQQQQQHVFDEFGPIINPTTTPSRSYSTGVLYPSSYSSVPPLPPQPFLHPSPPHALATSPSPSLSSAATPAKTSSELDLNDPVTLDIYSRILLFKDDHMRDELAFSRTLSPKQRRVVHLVAQKLGVYHYSVGEGEDRYAVVTRVDPQSRPLPQRAVSQTFSRGPTSYLSPVSPLEQNPPPGLLRSKKSMPDMKTLHTPAPRLTSRSSNGNIREGYATIASSSRRTTGAFSSLFNSTGAFGTLGSSSNIPPVPSLPFNGLGGGDGLSSGVVRQPRGPNSSNGFNARRDRVAVSESAPPRGLESRNHDVLEL